jgi:hypothetical protein
MDRSGQSDFPLMANCMLQPQRMEQLKCGRIVMDSMVYGGEVLIRLPHLALSEMLNRLPNLGVSLFNHPITIRGGSF